MPDELDDDVSYFLNWKSSGPAVAEMPETAPGLTEEQQLAEDISYFNSWQPSDIGVLKGDIDKLSRPAQKRLAGFEARQYIDNVPASTRNAAAVTTGIGADVSSGAMRVANALPISPFADAAPDYANWVAEETNRIAAEKDKENKYIPPIVSRGLRGAARTIPVVGLAARQGNAYTGIATAAAIEGNQAITEGADAGLEGADLAVHAATQAAIEGGVAAIFQKAGWGGLESELAGGAGKAAVKQALMQGLKQAGIRTLQEIPEEVITELGHKLSGLDPDKTDPAVLAHVTWETIVHTGITMGLVESPQLAANAAGAMIPSKRKVGPQPAAATTESAAAPEIQTGEVQETQAAPSTGPVTPSEAEPTSEVTLKGGTTLELPGADPLLQQVRDLVTQRGNLSVTDIQRELGIPQARAQRLFQMELASRVANRTKQAPADQPTDTPKPPANVEPIRQESVPVQPDGTVQRTQASSDVVEQPSAAPKPPETAIPDSLTQSAAEALRHWLSAESGVSDLAPQFFAAIKDMDKVRRRDVMKIFSDISKKAGRVPEVGALISDYAEISPEQKDEVRSSIAWQFQSPLAGVINTTEDASDLAKPASEKRGLRTDPAQEFIDNAIALNASKRKIGPLPQDERTAEQIIVDKDAEPIQGMPPDLTVEQKVEWKEIRNNILSPDQAMRLPEELAQQAYAQSPKGQKRKKVGPASPKELQPGTPEKVGLLAKRVESGEPVFQATDPSVAADRVSEPTAEPTSPESEAETAEVGPKSAVLTPQEISQAKRSTQDVIQGMELAERYHNVRLKEVDPQNEAEQDAADFIKQRGLQPVFVAAKDGSQLPVFGLSYKDVVFLRSGKDEDALWEAVTHELIHGLGIDRNLAIADDLVERELTWKENKPGAKSYIDSVPPYFRDMLNGMPDIRRREGVALLGGRFMRDKGFRDRLRGARPTAWQAFRDGILDVLGDWAPKHKAAKAVIEALRAPSAPQTSEVSNAEVAPAQPIEAVRHAADVAEATAPRDEALGFFGGTSARRRNDGVPDAAKHPDTEVERQLDQAYGQPKASVLDGIKKMSGTVWNSLTRAQINIPNDGDHAVMNEMFRLLKQHPATSQDEALRNIAAYTEALGPQQLQLLTRKVIIDNLLASVDRGEPRRFGFESRDEIAAYKDQLDALVAASPEVTKAFESRRQIVRAMYQLLRSKDLMGDLIEKRPDGTEDWTRVDTYFHQQVLDHLTTARKAGRNPQITKKGFQKRRVNDKDIEEFDESLNYNTSLIEADFEYMRDAYLQAAKQDWLEQLQRRFDILPRLKAEAKARTQQTGKETTWQDILRENHSDTHKFWQAAPGNQFWQATGVKEKVVADVLAGIAADAKVTADDLSKVLAMGGKLRPQVMPIELVEQLESMQEPLTGGDPLAKALGEFSAELQRMWKTRILFSPDTLLRYMTGNLAGDLDFIVGGAPMALGEKLSAMNEMAAYYGVGQTQQINLSPELTLARDYGVIDASLSANELPDIQDLYIFKRFLTEKAGLGKLVKGWYDWARKVNSFRESSGRYAVFKYYRKALQAGPIAHYGSASKEKVDAIRAKMGKDAAAAHLARQLVGDYGDLTVAGNYLRKHLIPFWSFTEITLKHYPQVIYNAALFGPRKVGKNPQGAALSAGALALVALPYLLTQLFNNLIWGDEEDKLSDAERAQPHIILGKNADGSLIIKRNLGAFGEFMELFGLNTAIARLDELQAGQMSATEILGEMVKSVGYRHLNSIRPDMKALIEIPTGTSLFPEPRKSNWDDTLANMAGAPDTYRTIKGLINRDGTRARPHSLERLLGVTDPEKNSYYEIAELRDRYLNKLGKGGYPRNPMLGNMQNAAENSDQDQFTEARLAWLTRGSDKEQGNWDKFQDKLSRIDPLALMNQTKGEDKDFIENYLTPDQRKTLKRAQDFAQETKINMVLMWREAEKHDPPELQEKLRSQKEAWLLRQAGKVMSNLPEAVAPGERKLGLTLSKKESAWREDRAEALLNLSQSGLTNEELVKLYSGSVFSDLDTVGQKGLLKDRTLAERRATDTRSEKVDAFAAALAAER